MPLQAFIFTAFKSHKKNATNISYRYTNKSSPFLNTTVFYILEI